MSNTLPEQPEPEIMTVEVLDLGAEGTAAIEVEAAIGSTEQPQQQSQTEQQLQSEQQAQSQQQQQVMVF